MQRAAEPGKQPKPTSLEVLGDGSGNVDGDSGREAAAGRRRTPKDGAERCRRSRQPEAKAKDAKPAPERKRARNLSEDKRFKLFSGTANRPLAEEIGRHIGVTVGEAKLQRFADGEVYFQLLENVRGVDVFVVQPTCYPVDQHLVELLVMIDALKRASAARITVVVPYYGYARQDRKDRPRVAISAKLIADLLTTAGANRALFVDLHAAQIQGFFNIPVDHLFASPVLVSYFRELKLPNLIVVSPDAGGVERARFFAQKMEAPLAIVDKRRTDMNVAEVMHVVGDVNGKTLPDHRRHHRHGGNAGEDRRCPACQRRGDGSCLRQPCRAFGAGHRSHCRLAAGAGGGDQHHSAARSGTEVSEDQGAFDCRACWARPSRAFIWRPA